MNALSARTVEGEVLNLELNEFWRENPDVDSLRREFDGALAGHAILMAEHGVSYRIDPLQVGSGLVGKTARGLILAEGYNYSPYKGAPKYCAEINATESGDEMVREQIVSGDLPPATKDEAPWQVLLGYVAAFCRPDTNLGINNLDAPTVHPCGTPCRGWLLAHPAFSLDTRFDTFAINRESGLVVARENYTLGGFDELYQDVTTPAISRELMQATSFGK